MLSYHYKEHISGFRQWDQAHHAHDFVLFKQNLGVRLSMDETCLSQGELYTIVTNKAAKEQKGSLVAMVKGTKSEMVLHYNTPQTSDRLLSQKGYDFHTYKQWSIMANRRKFSSAFKSRVALEALKERETLAELSTRFEVSQEMISRWKGEFLRLSAGVFDKKQSLQADDPSVEVKALRAKVSELTMERDFFVDACRRSGLKVK